MHSMEIPQAMTNAQRRQSKKKKKKEQLGLHLVSDS